MKLLLNLIAVTVLAILCTIPFVAQKPSDPTPEYATKAEVSALVQSVATLTKEASELKGEVGTVTKRLDRLFPKGDPGEHSVLSDEQQREKFEADYPAVAKVVFEPKSCPAPEVVKADLIALREEFQKQIDQLKPKAKPAKKSAPSKLTAAINDAKSSHQRLAIYLTQDKCNPCRAFEANVLDSPRFKQVTDGNISILTLNWDHDKDASEFTHGDTPNIVVYDPEADKWDHGFIPQPSVNWMLDKLGLSPIESEQQPKTRRRIL